MLAKGCDKVEVLSTEEQEGGVQVVHFKHPAFRYFQASIMWVIDPTLLSTESKVTGPLGIVSGHVKQTFVPDESDGKSVQTKMTESAEVTSPLNLGFVANVIRDSNLEMTQEEGWRKEHMRGESCTSNQPTAGLVLFPTLCILSSKLYVSLPPLST